MYRWVRKLCAKFVCGRGCEKKDPLSWFLKLIKIRSQKRGYFFGIFFRLIRAKTKGLKGIKSYLENFRLKFFMKETRLVLTFRLLFLTQDSWLSRYRAMVFSLQAVLGDGWAVSGGTERRFRGVMRYRFITSFESKRCRYLYFCILISLWCLLCKRRRKFGRKIGGQFRGEFPSPHELKQQLLYRKF